MQSVGYWKGWIVLGKRKYSTIAHPMSIPPNTPIVALQRVFNSVFLILMVNNESANAKPPPNIAPSRLLAPLKGG